MHVANEALREKVLLLGELHEILSKFHILEMEFLHEKMSLTCSWCVFLSFVS